MYTTMDSVKSTSELYKFSGTGSVGGIAASSAIVGSRTQVCVTTSTLHVNRDVDDDDDDGDGAGEGRGRRRKRRRNRLEPDGSYSWMVLGASFIANLIADGCLFSFGVLYVELLDYFKESKSKTAWVGSLFMATPLVTGPLASIITNRFGCRKTTILGAVLAAIGFVFSSFTNSIGELCFTLGIIAGMGLSMVDVAANVIVAYYFERRRAFATSTAAAGSGIGTFIFAILTEKLVELYTWKGAMLVTGGIMLNMIVCGALFLPVENVTGVVEVAPNDVGHERPGDAEVHSAIGAEEDCGETTSSIAGTSDNNNSKKHKSRCESMLWYVHPVQVKSFVKDTLLNGAICHSVGFIYFSISCFMLYMWYDIPYIYIPDKAIEMGIPDSMASFLVSIIGIVSTVGQIVIGYLGDRPEVDTFYLYSALTAVAGIVTIVVPLMKNYAGLATYAGAYGMFISANYALTAILLVELVGLEHLTSGYGLLLLVQGIANLIGPPVAGWITDTTHSYDGTFYASGAGIIASGLMLFARPWLIHCAPHRYYGSEVNKLREEAERNALLHDAENGDVKLAVKQGKGDEEKKKKLGADISINGHHHVNHKETLNGYVIENNGKDATLAVSV